MSAMQQADVNKHLKLMWTSTLSAAPAPTADFKDVSWITHARRNRGPYGKQYRRDIGGFLRIRQWIFGSWKSGNSFAAPYVPCNKFLWTIALPSQFACLESDCQVSKDMCPFNLRSMKYTRGYMTLGRCPLSIFCSRRTPPRVYKQPERDSPDTRIDSEMCSFTQAFDINSQMYLLISFRKSTLSQKRQLIVYYYQLKNKFDDFVEELTF